MSSCIKRKSDNQFRHLWRGKENARPPGVLFPVGLTSVFQRAVRRAVSQTNPPGAIMLIRENDATDTPRASRSRVGESLRRLQQNIEQTRQTSSHADEQFAAWHEKWSDRR